MECTKINAPFVGIRGMWTSPALVYINKTIDVVEDLNQYWPLTLRQVYYQLVAGLAIENSVNSYKKLSRMLSNARLDSLIPWGAVEDRSRIFMPSAGWQDKDHFISEQLGGLLVGYRRDLLQSQSVALEVWIEKDALSHICHNVAFDYCVPVVVAKGFSSVTFKDKCRGRILRNRQAGKKTIILYFGDLDPSGWEMLPAMMRTLQNEMQLGDAVEAIRCGLLPQQVFDYNLPRSLDAMKQTDSRTPKYKAMLRSTGQPEDLAVELDALTPALLENLVKDSIEDCLDLSAFDSEQVKQAAERKRLATLSQQARSYIESLNS